MEVGVCYQKIPEHFKVLDANGRNHTELMNEMDVDDNGEDDIRVCERLPLIVCERAYVNGDHYIRANQTRIIKWADIFWDTLDLNWVMRGGYPEHSQRLFQLFETNDDNDDAEVRTSLFTSNL